MENSTKKICTILVRLAFCFSLAETDFLLDCLFAISYFTLTCF
jgi:hypothetical protein